MSKRLIYAEDAIDALHDEIVRRRIDEDTNDDGALDEFDTEAILRRLPSAQPQRWIPVTDRLPEENKEVLICTDDGILHIAEHEVFFDRVYWEETTEYRTVENVVAWMPLPDPWKGGQE